MKKILLSIALAALSAGAYATGGGQRDGFSYDYSGVRAQVGGSVHAYSGPANGYGPSAISMGSFAGAVAGADGSGGSYDLGYWTRNRCRWNFVQTGVNAHTGADVYGGALSATWGHSTGAARGSQYAGAEYQAGAGAFYDNYGYSQHAGTGSYAYTDGFAWTGSALSGDDFGFSVMGTTSGASNFAVANANRDWTGGVNVDGLTYGESYSLSGGLSLGSATGGASSYADQAGWADSYTTDGIRRRDSRAEGSLHVNSDSFSGVSHIGLAGTRATSGGSYLAGARDGRLVDWAYAGDTKFATANSFRLGNADAESLSNAYVGALGRAGSRISLSDGI